MLAMLFASWWRSLFLPNTLPTKTAKTPQKAAAQPEAPVTSAEPVISEDFLDALIDRLEERAFVYDAPYSGAEGFPFRKENVA